VSDAISLGSGTPGVIRGNCLVCAVGRLRPESPLRGELDFGDGRIVVGSDQPQVAAQISGVAAESVVAVTGALRVHRWTVGNGQPRERLELAADRLVVLYDAREGRLLP